MQEPPLRPRRAMGATEQCKTPSRPARLRSMAGWSDRKLTNAPVPKLPAAPNGPKAHPSANLQMASNEPLAPNSAIDQFAATRKEHATHLRPCKEGSNTNGRDN